MPNIEKVAQEAAGEAGKILSQAFKKFDRGKIDFKSHHEIVTKADVASEKKIISVVKKCFPDHSILAEESGSDKKESDYLWVIDPLDGTTNFTIHNPLWSISIAVAYKGKVILGLVYAPILDELFVARAGQGALRNNKRLKVSDMGPARAVNTFCHGSSAPNIKKALTYMRHQKLNGLDCRQLGSAAIELAFVASGRVESIMIPGAHPWDVAAGVLLVREAGGKVTDFKGVNWNLSSRDILASNKKVHKNILELL